MAFDFHKLNNPVMEYPDWSIKDACMAWRDGTFHLFFSAFDQERSTVVHVTTTDFREFSPFKFQLDGRDNGWIGMCSPDVTYGDGRYVIVLNSWGEADGRPNAMFTIESEDLEHWSAIQPLGHNLAPEARIIDGALAWTGGHWICVCKWWNQPRVASAPSLDGPWQWIADERARLLTSDGEENGFNHENFQLIEINGRWHLLSTDYLPGKRKGVPVSGSADIDQKPFKRGVAGAGHMPWLYRMEGDPAEPHSWLSWVDGRELAVPYEEFNTIDRVNAAALKDHRGQDGFFYLIYGGKNDCRRDEFAGTAAHGRPWPRGWNRLGIARSRDLHRWELPGATGLAP